MKRRTRKGRGDMAEKELRRLKRRELLQMLIVQCEETERLQQELDETSARLAVLEESYERLKVKLNVKDERLNQKDAAIAELNGTIEEMRTTKLIELNEAGSIAEAALRLNGIFEVAQRSAEQYLLNVKRLCGEATAAAMAGERQASDGADWKPNREADRRSDILDVSQAYARRKNVMLLSQEKACIVQDVSLGAEEAPNDMPLASSGGVHG